MCGVKAPPNTSRYMSLFRPLLRPARGAQARRRWASVAAVATPAVAKGAVRPGRAERPGARLRQLLRDRPATARLDEHRRGRPRRRSEGLRGDRAGHDGIPGDITSQVSGVTASSDNPPGETAAKVDDGDVQQQVGGLPPDRVAQPDLPEGHDGQALCPGLANDGRSGTPGAWQLYNSNDGITLDHPGHQDGAELRPALPGAGLRLPDTTAYTVYRLNVTRCKARIRPRCWP